MGSDTDDLYVYMLYKYTHLKFTSAVIYLA